MKETIQTLQQTINELTDGLYAPPDLIDAAQVVAQLRGQGASQPAVQPSDAQPFTSDVPRVLETANLHRLVRKYQAAFKVTFYRPIVSNRKLLGAPVRFVKKVIRKGTGFLMAPVVDDQNTFNAYATETLDELVRNDQRTQSFMDCITQKVEQLHTLQQQSEAMLLQKIGGQMQALANAYRTEQAHLHALMQQVDALREENRALSLCVQTLQSQLRQGADTPSSAHKPVWEDAQ